MPKPKFSVGDLGFFYAWWFMPFITALRVEPVPRSDRRKLLWPLLYVVPSALRNGLEDSIVVPVGFTTDYASIPRVLFSLFPRDAGDTRRPAVVHDFLYANHLGYSRRQVDSIFRGALREEGAGWFKRWSMWSAVRAAGWRFWA